MEHEHDYNQSSNQNNTIFKDEESNFNMMEWLMLLLHYWYFFLISVLVFLGLGYLKNKSWQPVYRSLGTVMIQEASTRAPNQQAFMRGFGIQGGYYNINNQVVILSSYDLLGRVIDSLPFIKVDYLKIDRFKKINVYDRSPIRVESDFVAPEAYDDLTFKVDMKDSEHFVLTVHKNKQYSNVRIEGVFGKPVQCNLFFGVIYKSPNFHPDTDIFFRFRSKGDLIAEFMSKIELDYLMEGSSVLSISLKSATPARDMDFINTLSEVFLDDNLRHKNDVAIKTIDFIDEQLRSVSGSLSKTEDEMTRFRQDNQMVSVSAHSDELLLKKTGYDDMSKALRLREKYFDYLTSYLNEGMEEEELMSPSSFNINDETLVSAITKLNRLYLERASISEKSPYYPVYNRDIVHAKQIIKETISQMRVALDIEKNDLKESIHSLMQQIEMLPQKELEMTAIERNYRIDDSYYTFFLQRRAEAQIQKASNSPDNTVLDKARITELTNRGVKRTMIILFTLIGFLIPALTIIFKELLNNTIRTARDVERNADFPLIGAVRHTKSKDPVLVAKSPRSSFTEMFRVIRTRIEFIVQRKNNIMLMISSTESGDGKTYFSINLAAIYAMTGRKTLLIDMDIRKPSVSGRLDIETSVGVTNALIDEIELSQAIVRTEQYKFDILPAGTVPPNPGELIRSDKLREAFAELRKMYDYIIIDTSPMGLVADAYSIASLSDINLFVVRSEKTNKSFFRKLAIQLKMDKIPNLYTVLNDEMSSKSKYYNSSYSYSYGYNSGYGYGYYGSKNRKKAAETHAHYYDEDTDF
ncbi:MAG: polysaccharide biosynthesis tyrosine autokinase [Prevotellaceae bacterium]|jgi:capsular exopolysaccharide synthesis family protein|nr:polysaccharide biosynthesis tyrosine autokinase [Prevotellaceae bacterium]